MIRDGDWYKISISPLSTCTVLFVRVHVYLKPRTVDLGLLEHVPWYCLLVAYFITNIQSKTKTNPCAVRFAGRFAHFVNQHPICIPKLAFLFPITKNNSILLVKRYVFGKHVSSIWLTFVLGTLSVSAGFSPRRK